MKIEDGTRSGNRNGTEHGTQNENQNRRMIVERERGRRTRSKWNDPVTTIIMTRMRRIDLKAGWNSEGEFTSIGIRMKMRTTGRVMIRIMAVAVESRWGELMVEWDDHDHHTRRGRRIEPELKVEFRMTRSRIDLEQAGRWNQNES